MSFILDALKKSEDARQRRIGPSLADAPVRPRGAERPWWIAAVVGLLVLNLVVLAAVVLTRGDRNAAAREAASQSPAYTGRAPAAAPHVASNSNPAPATTPRPTGSPAVRSLADEADAASWRFEDAPPHAIAAAVPEGPPKVRQIDPGAATYAPRLPERTEEEEVLPTHADLVASGTSLPDMHLDIHVHSPNPAERFVFVNMRKYVEGQALQEGPRLERITPDGAVLNHRGLRFLLARQ